MIILVISKLIRLTKAKRACPGHSTHSRLHNAFARHFLKLMADGDYRLYQYISNANEYVPENQTRLDPLAVYVVTT